MLSPHGSICSINWDWSKGAKYVTSIVFFCKTEQNSRFICRPARSKVSNSAQRCREGTEVITNEGVRPPGKAPRVSFGNLTSSFPRNSNARVTVFYAEVLGSLIGIALSLSVLLNYPLKMPP